MCISNMFNWNPLEERRSQTSNQLLLNESYFAHKLDTYLIDFLWDSLKTPMLLLKSELVQHNVNMNMNMNM